jgi:hypothetical protein
MSNRTVGLCRTLVGRIADEPVRLLSVIVYSVEQVVFSVAVLILVFRMKVGEKRSCAYVRSIGKQSIAQQMLSMLSTFEQQSMFSGLRRFHRLQNR